MIGTIVIINNLGMDSYTNSLCTFNVDSRYVQEMIFRFREPQNIERLNYFPIEDYKEETLKCVRIN